MAMKITIQKQHKSIPAGVVFELPDFCVLTGKNGSGKTHLLEAIKSESTMVFDDKVQLKSIKHYPFNSLNSTISENAKYSTVRGKVHELWNNFKELKNNYIERNYRESKSFKEYVESSQHHNPLYNTVRRIFDVFNIDPEEIVESHFIAVVNASNETFDDIFKSSMADIFISYYHKKIDNQFMRFRSVELNDKAPWISDEAFLKAYGNPPWENINSILEYIRLPYRINSPESLDRDSNFKIAFHDPVTMQEVPINDISTGERVILSLAIGIYNAENNSSKVDLLLLDEPDAPLHPEYSKYLIDIIKKYIVKGSGIKVILTTHSPSTVACATDVPIFQINRDSKVPEPVTQLEALHLLTKDIIGLRVSVEKRRQVFVEHEYDVEYYESIWDILNRDFKPFEFQPQFMSPHSRPGCNKDDVLRVVDALVKAGSDSVWGIIDYDSTNSPSNRIVVLGSTNRYSIENYVFDPIIVGILLLRESLVEASVFGIKDIITDTSFSTASMESIQAVADYICLELGLSDGEKKPCELMNGFIINIPKQYLMLNGHDLETMILGKWVGLNTIKRGRTEDNHVKIYIIKKIFGSYSHLISKDFDTLFRAIL